MLPSKRSFEYLQRAMIELEPDFNSYNLLSNPNQSSSRDPRNLYDLITQKARLFYLIYIDNGNIDYLHESLNLYKIGDQITDIIRNSTFSDQTKLNVSGEFKRNTDFALITLNQITKESDEMDYRDFAFRLMEKSRYAQLLSNLSRVQSMSNTNLPDSLRRREQTLLLSLESQKMELKNSIDSLKQTELLDRIFELEREYQAFQGLLAQKYPAYYEVKYDSILLSITDIQKLQKPNTQILEYFWGREHINVLSISKDNSELTSISITDSLAESINSFLEFIVWPKEGELDISLVFQDYLNLSNRIYLDLVTPFINDNVDKLIISPDGVLSLIPFEALIIDKQPANFKTANYLLKSIDIQYAYSLNLLFKSSVTDPKKNPSMLVFGYSNEDEINSGTGRNTNEEIPGSALEVKMISSLFKGKNNQYLTGVNASETTFKQLAPDFDIIHLAVHGTGDPGSALNSRLEFKADLDTINDGKLYAHELYNLNLNKLKLAVLSSCETGIGKEYAGEGIFSIARGFAYAGCPISIMSLWKVSDNHTAQIMEIFYLGLSQGLEVSEALRQAKLAYIESADSRFANPFYWAALVPLGDTSPIFKPSDNFIFNLFWLVPVFLVVFFLLRRRL